MPEHTLNMEVHSHRWTAVILQILVIFIQICIKLIHIFSSHIQQLILASEVVRNSSRTTLKMVWREWKEEKMTENRMKTGKVSTAYGHLRWVLRSNKGASSTMPGRQASNLNWVEEEFIRKCWYSRWKYIEIYALCNRRKGRFCRKTLKNHANDVVKILTPNHRRPIVNLKPWYTGYIR